MKMHYEVKVNIKLAPQNFTMITKTEVKLK